MKRRKCHHIGVKNAVFASATGLGLIGSVNVYAVNNLTFTPTAAGTYNWDNSGSQNNWGTGAGGTSPNGAGDTANLTSAIAGTVNLRLGIPTTLGSLVIGTGSGTQNFAINNNNSSDVSTPANILTFQSALAGGGTSISVSSPGVTHNISAGVSLGGTSPLTITDNGTASLNFLGTFAANSNTATVSGTGTGTIVYTGDITGTSSARIVQSGTNTLKITNSVKSFAGTYVANNGTISTQTGSFSNAALMLINGYWSGSGSGINTGGLVSIGDNNPASVNPGQRLSATAITMNGGHLNDGGQTLTVTATGGTVVSDTVGTLTFNSAYSMISMAQGGNTTETDLTATTVVRSTGATASVRSGTLGTTNKLLVGSGLTLLGAGGAAGTTTMSVLPWVTAANSNAFDGRPSDLATYVSGVGIRALNSAEYDTTLAGTSTRNVSVSSLALAADQTVNSLKYTTGSAGDLGAGRKLTVTSGGVMFGLAGGSGGIGTTTASTAGTLAFGAAEAVIWSISSSINTIGSVMTGTGGLTKAGSGTLTLTGANTLSGKIFVSGGKLRVGDGTNASNIRGGDVEVADGATLQLSSVNDISDTATVTLDQYGLFNGKVILDSGINEQVGALYFGTVLQAFGTWGSTSSSATNKTDLFFSGSGILNVVAVPEPTTVSIVGLGAIGLLPRRRRRILC